MHTDSKLGRELAELETLSRDELSVRWQKQYGCSPPAGVRRDLLIRSATWHLQAKRLGGHSAETRRRLKAAIADVGMAMAGRRNKRPNEVVDEAAITSADEVGGTGISPKPKRREVWPGARLIRDWNGKTYVVDVIEGGYVFEAKVYSSLTAIAGKITGVHWSGPRFFGL